MPIWDAVLVTLAGFVAGVINTAVGSGSLVTYPVLVLAGLPPITANITNTVGLVPGSLAGAWAFRGELRQLHGTVLRLVPVAAAGAIGGAALLRVLPDRSFQFIVPVLILVAVLLVAFQPMIARRRGTAHRTLWVALAFTVFGSSVYGGYFGAAQGVILLGILGVFLDATLPQQTAVKNLLQATVNVVAAVFFIVSGGVDWLFAACVAVGALAGAPLGARLVRRLPARVFRVAIVAFGLVVAAVMITQLVAAGG